MRSSWRWRLAAIVGVWLGLVALLAAADMSPSPVPLAALVLVAGVIAITVLDLADLAAPVGWRPHRPTTSRAGTDHRVRSLQRTLDRGLDEDDTARLAALVTAVTDERLRTVHGIDRAVDPAGAAQRLGPRLRRVVDGTSGRGLRDPAFIARVLDELDAL